MALGSSPHTRGARFQLGDDHLVDGIIPAYAGSTRRCRRRWTTETDHPRIRGEHILAPPPNSSTKGSSPHTRGARPTTISTCGAGMDHPRIRGEHTESVDLTASRKGSSPHTRGARVTKGGSGVNGRIIPAYAGSTRLQPTAIHGRRDHPRIRGEHTYANMEQESILGSSPHTRGARSRSGTSAEGTSDHPRIRGEHQTIRKIAAELRGSSPHTRGARSRLRLRRRSGRIIPAYAGSTTGRTGWRPLVRDHPRIRGEHG